ncbi:MULTISPECIES: ABC transporter ATP-binding protein [unclassified Corynebacterium]|uniref:iron ABC transporter ATP-binding protein n=1 Tax=unclassified Corynebacterium TaxID=2624378 RepID=UPI002168AB49|nr:MULTISPECIES: ATP-binding cassette domain-containing protein [unclassified Corynebacterium]MCS4491570.1 ATP-binding cassette domain-containing protein [Corynebacterium sp. ES2715-CONJ3]MCS4531331.1 ATP-binding cassette domain-containing protein [Corynebacterium sp. ES2730-CONJ]
MIELKDVVKSYAGETTIGPITAKIPAHGITALIGPNGAGKSTIMTMIGRLLDCDAGQITVGGCDVHTTKSKDLAKILSVLRQENHFVTKLTVRQLVGFGRFPYSQGRLNSDDEEIITKYIEFFHLKDLQNRYLDQLSGGQRQRAYVAMVLAQETEYVLLDEPLNNLDIAHSVDMMRHLHRAAKSLGRTIIVVLHDINFAARYADYVVACKSGKIVAFGSVDEVINSDILSSIFNTQVTVIDGPDGRLACYH